MYLCASVPVFVGTFALSMTMLLGTLIGVGIFHPRADIGWTPLIRCAVNMGVLVCAFGAFGLLFGAAFRRRVVAIGATVAVMALADFIEILAGLWPLMEPLKPLSFYTYYDVPATFQSVVSSRYSARWLPTNPETPVMSAFKPPSNARDPVVPATCRVLYLTLGIIAKANEPGDQIHCGPGRLML